MAVNNKFTVTSANLDMSFVSDLTAEDKKILADQGRLENLEKIFTIAKKDGDTTLEINDCSINPFGSTNSKFKNPFSHAENLFKQRRREVIDIIVELKTVPLKKEIPDLDLHKLSQLIWLNAFSVKQVSVMVEKLVTAVLKFKSTGECSTQDVFKFSQLWTNLYNLKEANQTWVAGGHPGILPGQEMDEFVDKTLQRLEDRAVGFKLLDENDRTAVLRYDDYDDEIMMQELFPLLNQDSNYAVPSSIRERRAEALAHIKMTHALFFSIGMGLGIPHEFYHMKQDEYKMSASASHVETEAEIFGNKCFMVLYGQGTSEIFSHHSGYFMTNPAQQRAAKEKPVKAKLDFYKMINKYANEHPDDFLSESRQVQGFKVAQSELTTGKIDTDGRQKFTEIYVKETALDDIMAANLIAIENTEGCDQTSPEYQAFLTAAPPDLKWSSFADYRQSNEGSLSGSGSAVDYYLAMKYITDATRRLYQIYYRSGPEEAQKFFEQEYMPQVYTPEIISALEDFSRNFDGLLKESHDNWNMIGNVSSNALL